MDSFSTERPELSVVIPLSGDGKGLQLMLDHLNHLTQSVEVILICPLMPRFSAPQTHAPWVRIVADERFHTYDEGRAIGARHAKGEFVLFLDERVVIPPLLLKAYMTALKNGADVVVTMAGTSGANRRNGVLRNAYRLLNHFLGRADLGAGTMSRVPYGCSRKALGVLGCESLATPPAAFVKAVLEKLVVVGVEPKPALQWEKGAAYPLKKGKHRILRDHAVAIQLLLQRLGKRGGLPDGDRYRSLLHVPGTLHLRSVYYQPPREDRGGSRDGKRKKKSAKSRRKKT